MDYLKQEENILSELTALYEKHGYKKYKPGCFEEYSLYLDNMDFLISKNVITFSGIGGKLLALRPDVTLSLINHAKVDRRQTQKLFYTEKVYRRAENYGEFREISQTGVEVFGDVDDVCEAEIGILILRTLAAISGDYLLDVSHMGFTEGLISSFDLTAENKAKVYNFLREKNVHDFEKLAESVGLGQEKLQAFQKMARLGGNAKDALSQAKEIALNDEMRASVGQLENLINTLCALGFGDKINLNFSIANNADYYNGIIFNGYIGGVPKAVLSGGRYDKLLTKLGKDGGAMGFALYLGELERYFKPEGNGVDILVLYDERTQSRAVGYSEQKIREGLSVRLAREVPQDLRFGKIINLTEAEQC